MLASRSGAGFSPILSEIARKNRHFLLRRQDNILFYLKESACAGRGRLRRAASAGKPDYSVGKVRLDPVDRLIGEVFVEFGHDLCLDVGMKGAPQLGERLRRRGDQNCAPIPQCVAPEAGSDVA
jgi:hypothetical protein